MPMSMRDRQSGPSIAADDEMDWGYVLVDKYALDQATALKILREQSERDWGVRLGTVTPVEPAKRSFKWRKESGEDELQPCDPDDPDWDSDWWIFDLSMNDHEVI